MVKKGKLEQQQLCVSAAAACVSAVLALALTAASLRLGVCECVELLPVCLLLAGSHGLSPAPLGVCECVEDFDEA